MNHRRIPSITFLPLVCVLLLFNGCTEIAPQDELPAITDVKALSMHYVEVDLARPASERAVASSSFQILAEDETPLEITGVTLVNNGTRTLLTTAPQDAVEYELRLVSPSNDRIASEDTGTSIHSFIGSTVGSPYLVSATPLSNSQLLLVFSQNLEEGRAANVSNYEIRKTDRGSARLAVTTAEVPKTPSTSLVVLTTAPQDSDSYTVSVRADQLGSSFGIPIDPHRNEANFAGFPDPDETGPSLLLAESISDTAVVLTFSEPLAAMSDDPANFEIDPPLDVRGAALNPFNTQILLATSPQRTGVTYTVLATGIHDTIGHQIVDGADSAIFEFVFDPFPENAPVIPGDPDGRWIEPRIMGAIASTNTTIDVFYSVPMGGSAVVAGNYFVVASNVNPEAGALAIESAEWGRSGGVEDRTHVILTSRSQSTIQYFLAAVGVFDPYGRPVGPQQVFEGWLILGAHNATFWGTGPDGAPVDSDGDGLPDNEEMFGWQVQVTLVGAPGEVERTTVRDVTSDPDIPDTDGDGLTDFQEATFRSDPRDPDTDDDEVEDFVETFVWGSSSTKQDSDGDGIIDSWEISLYKTSPRFADTDGDGLMDNEEVAVNNRDPRIADLPDPGIDIGQIALRLDTQFSFTNTQGEATSVSKSTSATLSQSDTRTFATSDTATTKLTAGVEIETGKEPKKIYKFDYARENTFNSSESSSQETQEQYQESLSLDVARDVTQSITRTVEGASVELLVTVNSKGEIPFTMRNLEITGVLQDPFDRRTFVPIATMLPGSELDGSGEFEVALGPFIPDRGPFIFKSTEVFPSLVEDLMKNPRGLIFEVANFDIVDEDGRNFAFITEDVNDRTAGLVIDFGNGEVDRFRVSTHSPLEMNACADAPDTFCRSDADCASGTCDIGDLRPVGVTMAYVFQDILGLKKNEPPNAITVGRNGCGETSAIGDDTQVVVPICPPAPAGGRIIEPGPNGILDTVPMGDDHRDLTTGRTIVDGGDGCAHTRASRDDVQVVPGACATAFPDGIMVLPGPDGVFQTRPSGDDVRTTVTGYGTERTGICDGNTDRQISPGNNGELDSSPAGDDRIEGQAIVPGMNGILESAPVGDDVLEGPGVECETDSECTGPGACVLVERLTRVKGVTNVAGERRFWVLLGDVDFAPDTDFDDVLLRSADAVALAYVQDQDEDGLLARDEYLYGSSDLDPNSDGCPFGDGASGCDPQLFDFDTVTDFEEVQEGWSVAVAGRRSYFAFPNPIQPDTDGDGLFDDEERVLGTDPAKRDTDDDGIADTPEVRGYFIEDREGALVRNVVPYQSAFIGPGANGMLDTELSSLDELNDGIITAGTNGVLDSRPDGDDVVSPAPLILDGGNGLPETTPVGDDISVIAAVADTTNVTVTFLDYAANGDACDGRDSGQFEFDLAVLKNGQEVAGSFQQVASVGRVVPHAFDPDKAFVVKDVTDKDQITISGTIRELDARCESVIDFDPYPCVPVIIQSALHAGIALSSIDPIDDSDDVQLVAVGAPVAGGQAIIGPGGNGILESEVAREVLIDGGNGTADTSPSGDDQLVSGIVVSPGQAIIAPGPNGFIDTIPQGDDMVVAADEELIDAFVPALAECASCPVEECALDCNICTRDVRGASENDVVTCSGDTTLLKGAACENGTCAWQEGDDVWHVLESRSIAQLSEDQTISLRGNPLADPPCFTATILNVHLAKTTEARVEPGAVMVRSGPNGTLETSPSGDDVIGAPHLTLFATNPLSPDTDGDTLTDGAEQVLGANPNDARDASKFRDNDLDGLANVEETEGWFVGYLDEETGRFRCRTAEVDENDWVFIDVFDTAKPPADCVRVTSDRFEPDTDLDGLPDLLEKLIHSDPRDEDTDGDGLLDLDEFNPDSRFSVDISVLREFQRRCGNVARCSFVPEEDAFGTSVVRADTDVDGRDDRSEIFDSYVILPCIQGDQLPIVVASNPLLPDGDFDGLLDGEERDLGTDPNNPDTDADGLTDGRDPEPTGCGFIVDVSFENISVGDDCDSGGDGEFGFDFTVSIGEVGAEPEESCTYEFANNALDDFQTWFFPEHNPCHGGPLSTGDAITISGKVRECDGDCPIFGQFWEFERVYELEDLRFGDNSITIRAEPGDELTPDNERCYDDDRLLIKIEASQG